MRDKILGMLLGGAIGDALGMPVETWSPDKIRSIHPKGVEFYVDPVDHKWFTTDVNDASKTYMRVGSITDDTQLTIATVKGLISGHKKATENSSFAPYMDEIAKEHISAMNKTIAGWGKSTVEAVERLKNGVHWSESGKTNKPNRGTGNGVPMKCSPLALWLLSTDYKVANDFLVSYSAMTHYTKMSAEACVYHTYAIQGCLLSDSEDFANNPPVLRHLYDHTWGDKAKSDGKSKVDTSHLNTTKDNLEDPFLHLMNLHNTDDLSFASVDDLRAAFGCGSCYVYDSLPFVYAWFLRNPFSFQTILDVVNAGGDTDTNAKMVGELIGALHGISFFETRENIWTLQGLPCRQELMDLGNELCDTFGIH